MGTILKLIKNNARQYTMIIFLVVIVAIFQVLTNGAILIPMNITNILLQNAYVFILGIGMMILLINGGNIDLSVGSVAAFIGAVAGVMIIDWHMSMWTAIMVSLIIGAVVGIWQGYWVAYFRIPGFIVTLAGQLIFRGLTNVVLKGLTLAPFPKTFIDISCGYVKDVFAGLNSKLNLTAIALGIIICVIYILLQVRGRANKRKHSAALLSWPLFLVQLVVISAVILVVSFWLARYQGIPIIVLIIGVLVVAYHFFLSKTVSGRYIYAMGGNEKAAKLSGINVNKVLFFCYVNMGVLAAVAGIASASRIDSASPYLGVNYEFDAISACFVGGASMYGGVGTAIGAIIGCLVIGILNNGLSILGLSTYIVAIIKGLVLLFVVAFDMFSKSRSKSL